MLQTATVISVSDNGMAQVVVKRASACGHDCTSCGACGIMDKPLIIEVENSVFAAVGDCVEIESETKKILSIAGVVYLMPILLFFALYLVCFSICKKDSLSITVGCAGFAIGVFLAFAVNRREAKNKTVESRIVRVL